jgi:hypothetical protein
MESECETRGWVLYEDIQSKDIGIQYLDSLYWAVATITSTGYGDVRAHSVEERAIASVTIVFGRLMVGYIMGAMASFLVNLDSQRVRYAEKLTSISVYMVQQKVPESLVKRVIEYYDYLWQKNKGVDGKGLFVDMPFSLQAEVSLNVNKDIIDKVPLFKDADVGFVRMLSLVIKPYVFLRNEYIVRKGDIGQEMFFVHRGQVEVVSEDKVPKVWDTMQSGAFFGEISLIFSVPRTASIRAATITDMFVLAKSDLESVLEHYPEFKEKIVETAKERMNAHR